MAPRLHPRSASYGRQFEDSRRRTPPTFRPRGPPRGSATFYPQLLGYPPHRGLMADPSGESRAEALLGARRRWGSATFGRKSKVEGRKSSARSAFNFQLSTAQLSVFSSPASITSGSSVDSFLEESEISVRVRATPRIVISRRWRKSASLAVSPALTFSRYAYSPAR